MNKAVVYGACFFGLAVGGWPPGFKHAGPRRMGPRENIRSRENSRLSCRQRRAEGWHTEERLPNRKAKMTKGNQTRETAKHKTQSQSKHQVLIHKAKKQNKQLRKIYLSPVDQGRHRVKIYYAKIPYQPLRKTVTIWKGTQEAMCQQPSAKF